MYLIKSWSKLNSKCTRQLVKQEDSKLGEREVRAKIAIYSSETPPESLEFKRPQDKLSTFLSRLIVSLDICL
jgi:helix-turn-helix protein